MKSAADAITQQLKQGKPLTPYGMDRLRKAGREDALRVNASNIITVMVSGGRVTPEMVDAAMEFYPERVKEWQESGGSPHRGSKEEQRRRRMRRSCSTDANEAPRDVGTPLDNPQHERYAQLLASGLNQAEAYRSIFPNAKRWAETTLSPRACKLAKVVRPRVQELQALAASGAVITAREMQERLSSLFRMCADEQDVDGAVKVGSLLSKVAGYEAPKNVNVRDGGITEDYVPPHIRLLSDTELEALLRGE